MKRAKPKQHYRRLKSGKKILINKGVKKKQKRRMGKISKMMDEESWEKGAKYPTIAIKSTDQKTGDTIIEFGVPSNPAFTNMRFKRLKNIIEGKKDKNLAEPVFDGDISTRIIPWDEGTDIIVAAKRFENAVMERRRAKKMLKEQLGIEKILSRKKGLNQDV